MSGRYLRWHGSGARAAAGAAALSLLGGCGHRDVVDAPVTWWHQLQGGAIAEQRPPPPNSNDPYPLIGTTPPKAPEVASMALRQSVTQQLIQQRNLSTRENAEDPIPAAPPPPARTAPVPATAAPAPAGQASSGQAAATPPAAAASSASFDAADAPSSSKPAAAKPAAAPDAGELAMPEVKVADAGTGAPVTLPPIPAAPPPTPGLPNIAVPETSVHTAPERPAYNLSDPHGTLFRFVEGSDALQPGQDGQLHALEVRRNGGTLFIHGYGDAADASPAGQAQAVTLATLRARRVAERLQQDGVPAAAIRLRADAFGRGASVELVD